MLVTFSCDAHENITMFGHIAQIMLKLMGQSGTVPSAIVAEQVPEALAKLKVAIDEEKKKTPLMPKIEDDSDDEEQDVSLAHRALPLIQLLQDAVKEKCDVMWK